MRRSLALLIPLIFCTALLAQTPPVCSFTQPTASFSIQHVPGHPDLTVDPESAVWKGAASQFIVKDCRYQADYEAVRTEVRAFWTDTDIYFLFRCPYNILNVFPSTGLNAPHPGLWDKDVVEMFLGDDWVNIRHYREFEIAPTGDWIDLAIDLNRDSYDQSWRSGWQTLARIDEAHKVWYTAGRIPLKSVSAKPVEAGVHWRMNLYRIEGIEEKSARHFMCWQPTCVINRDSNHVPEHFGTLTFEKAK